MLQEVIMRAVKLEGNSLLECQNNDLQQSKALTGRQEVEEQRSDTSIVEQVQYPLDDSSGPSSTSHLCPAPLCRQFWKAGAYNDGARGKVPTQASGKNYLHVHPMFLHSNATSHKWAFGAVAELLDNAVDEIQNGATFVIVDKIINPKDQSAALLIQDDGGGMDPDSLRRCMSFGFSDKSKGIGKYGNGFKTSTMRLGADVIVFSRRRVNKRVVNQSIGLLSYTFLSQKGYDRIVVPMVDYESNASTGLMEASSRYSRDHFRSNLSLLLQWSPYSSEQDLLMQFDDIGSHGTKVVVYNLWFNEDGKAELDFDSDPEDIRISGDKKKIDTLPAWKSANEQHIANRLHHSLRVYLSILYLRIPENFRIVLRGRVVEHHNMADDLKFIEYILYKPQAARFVEGQVVTTIGFLKEAPQINIHGFNVYHKNRLILPFWQVVSYADSRGRGVVGVLEANFIEPVHNKQDFERTSLLQKLEVRLKEMTWEYWDYHCGLIGYQVKKKPLTQSSASLDDSFHQSLQWKRHPQSNQTTPPVSLTNKLAPPGFREKRKDFDRAQVLGPVKRQAAESMHEIQPVELPINQSSREDQERTANLTQEKLKLQANCLEYEKSEKELNEKLSGLMNELKDAKCLYDRLLAEAEALDQMKDKKGFAV